MSQSLVAKEIQCSDLLRPKSQSLFLSLGSNPYRITWLRRVRAGVKRSRNLWSLPSVPKFSACLLSVEKLSEKWEYAETKANRQRRPNNNSLVIKNDQPGLNLGLSHCRQILYQLSLKGSPRTLEWVAYPFSSRSFWPRNQTRVSCIAGRFFTNWAIMEDGKHNQGPLIPSQGL